MTFPYFFKSARALRRRLEMLEQPPMFKNSLEPTRGFVLSIAISIPLGLIAYILFSYGLKPAVGNSFGSVVFSDFIGETFKAFCMLFVAFLLWSVVPSRRYGAALGALAGLGFGLGYQGISVAIGQPTAGQAIMVMVFLTLMDVISATFTGLGVFVLVSNRQKLNSFAQALLGLPLFFYFLAVVSWLVWNAFAFAAASNMTAEWALDIFIVIPLFAFLIRDFLGGHFNFQNFLHSMDETDEVTSEPPPPPPES